MAKGSNKKQKQNLPIGIQILDFQVDKFFLDNTEVRPVDELIKTLSFAVDVSIIVDFKMQELSILVVFILQSDKGEFNRIETTSKIKIHHFENYAVLDKAAGEVVVKANDINIVLVDQCLSQTRGVHAIEIKKTNHGRLLIPMFMPGEIKHQTTIR